MSLLYVVSPLSPWWDLSVATHEELVSCLGETTQSFLQRARRDRGEGKSCARNRNRSSLFSGVDEHKRIVSHEEKLLCCFSNECVSVRVTPTQPPPIGNSSLMSSLENRTVPSLFSVVGSHDLHSLSQEK
mgnify:CR=1 FL=1